MPLTAQQAVDWFRSIYGECSEDRAYHYLNRIHAEILSKIPSLFEVDKILTLTQGTRLYDMWIVAGETPVKSVQRAVYENSNVDRTEMAATTRPRLDNDEPLWDYVDNGRPQKYFLHSNATSVMLGVHPAPNVNTNANDGYPRIVCRVTGDSSVPLSGTDQLPLGILSIDLYTYGMCAKYAIEWDTEQKAAYWNGRYQAELDNNRRHVGATLQRTSARMLPAYPNRDRGVV